MMMRMELRLIELELYEQRLHQYYDSKNQYGAVVGVVVVVAVAAVVAVETVVMTMARYETKTVRVLIDREAYR